ncbi:MAG: EAL domain-containing protein, partial [Pseudomonadota bacterium]
TGELTKSTIVEAAAIYSLEMDDVGHLWFTVDGVGVYRIDTDNPAVEPERVFDYENLDQDVYMTQLVVQRNSSGNHEAWLSTTRGGVYRIVEGVADRVVNSPAMSDQTVYLVQPLADGTTVLATERGVYQYSSQEDRLEFYGALQGFTAISAKTHATYYDGGQHLWIGTNNGFARMDLSLPLPEVTTPRVSITKLMAGDTRMDESGGELPEVAGGQLLTEFAAVSTRHPQGMEYRYMLDGLDKDWSAPTTNHLIDYSGLAPGKYEFRVSARVAGGAWSMPVTRAFVVPTPYWRTGWFLALAAVASVLLVLGAVQLRLRSVAIANQRLKAEVAARTRSIEAARCELEVSYQQLKNESAERQKSDALRADVEARFRQAYENAPIGMALVNRHGSAYDTNPILEDMFWPDQVSDAPRSLTKIVMPHLEGDFARFFTDFINNEHGNDSQEFECQAASGDIRRLDFLLSAVRDDAGEIRYIVLLTHDVTESRAMTDKLAYQANYDDLTGLTNRRAFERHLKELGVSGTGMEDSYLLFLDLDRFKVVNDTCGHAAGDDLLRTAARTIQGCMRGSDLVARLGGDEFAIILHDTTEQVALDCAERIRAAIHTIDFAWEGDAFRIGVSIGIVPMKYGAMEIEELQQVADAACYAAKEAGRNRVHFVAGDSDEAIAHRGQMRWVQRLNYAIDNDRFSLFGQRIVPLADTGKPGDRIEILLRMRDRVTEKLIPPGAFLPAAERYGLQVRLDQWVVNRVVEMITTDQDPATAANRYWVNLSGASVSDSDFARHVIELVKAADLRPGVLNFEITESTAIRKLDDAARLIADLKAMGCEFALDDFGNGLSSFAYLKRLDVDYLKIDGQFIRDIVDDATDRIFVKSIIDIAHTLGVEVVAEFVENDAILEVVRDMGADYVQGFGVHRPAMFMPGDVTTVVAVPAATGTDSLRVG